MPIRRSLLVLTCISSLAGAVRAQPPQPLQPTEPTAPRQPKAPAQPAPPDSASNPGPIVTVEFSGGTAKQYVDAVRRAAGGGNVNVIMPKEAESVPLPAISLRDVSTYTALQGLEYATNAESGSQFSVMRLGKGDENSATFAIRYAQRPGPFTSQPTPPPRLETRVFSIRDLIEPPAGLERDPSMVASTETVLNALKAASQLDLEAKMAPPEFMFHKDSQLLIVRGTSEQQRTIESLLGQLIQSVASRRVQATATAERERTARLQKAEFQAQIDFNRSQQKLTAAELERATVNFARVNDMVKAGQASNAELDNARAQLDQARALNEQAKINARSLDERQAILEARVQAGGGADGGASGTPALVIYDYADLEQFSADIHAIVVAILKLRGGEIDIKEQVRGRGTMAVRATPAEHGAIVKALNAMRRAKANEPKLPGLDAEDLIRKNEGKEPR